MHKNRLGRAVLLGVLMIAGGLVSAQALAQDNTTQDNPSQNGAQSDLSGGKLLLTGGVSSISGAAGGGLTPWAMIGGYGTASQIGANAFCTYVGVQDYHLNDCGALFGAFNRVEVSFAHQSFNTEDVGAALGLGRGFTIEQNVVGVKVRLFGDAILDQNTWLPEVSVGIQHKQNDQAGLLHAIGAKSAVGNDYYISATKLFLSQSLLVDATLRFTKANQIGILGFGGDKHDGYQAELEGSVAYLLNRHLAIGAEYRQKPDNLNIAQEDDWYDAFVAYAPTKNISFTLAYANLGNVVIENHQRGLYASVQVGF